MNGLSILETGLFLGLYALLAGGWGLLYTLGRLQGSPALRRAAGVAYSLHSLAALVIILWTPLGPGWKLLLIASTAAFRAIPPVVWRFLEETHENRGFGT